MPKNLRMKAARARKGISQAALADLIGASRQSINAVESGTGNPSLSLCLQICHALGCTLDELFWEEPQLPDPEEYSNPDDDALARLLAILPYD